MILALSFMALCCFGRDEPGAFLQVQVAPFGLEQLADTTEGAQADPQRALDARVDWANA